MGLGSGSKTFLGGLFFHFFWPFRAIFWSRGANFGVGVRFVNIFITYLCTQSNFILEVQSYLFVFNSATFGASFAHFEPFGLFLGLGSGSKTFLGPAYID